MAEKLAGVGRVTGGRISDLVEDYVVSGIESLTALAKQAGNLEWLSKQPAKGVDGAYEQHSERTFRDAGAQGYLVKPVLYNQLVAEVVRIVAV